MQICQLVSLFSSRPGGAQFHGSYEVPTAATRFSVVCRAVRIFGSRTLMGGGVAIRSVAVTRHDEELGKVDQRDHLVVDRHQS